MSKIEELRKSLDIQDCTSDEIGTQFGKIAKNLINNFVIRKNDKLYRFVEIEFYYNTTDVTKAITYERETEAGEWFNHEFGVDLAFKSDKHHYGGILVRAMECDGKFCNGPLKCRALLFQFDALGDIKGVPCLEFYPREEQIVPVPTTRWNISEKQAFRFCIPKELWKDHNGYSAYPWDYKGNLKTK